MRKRSWSLALGVCALTSMAACDGADDTALEVGGMIDTSGGPVPAGSRVVALWFVHQPAGGNKLYKFGDGDVSGDSFELSFTAAPPPGALAAEPGIALGAAIVALIPDSFALPDGMVEETNELELALLGWSTQHAIVWRDGSAAAGTAVEWSNDFPSASYACGKCSPGPGSNALAPTSCSDVTLQTGSASALQATACDFL